MIKLIVTLFSLAFKSRFRFNVPRNYEVHQTWRQSGGGKIGIRYLAIELIYGGDFYELDEFGTYIEAAEHCWKEKAISGPY